MGGGGLEPTAGAGSPLTEQQTNRTKQASLEISDDHAIVQQRPILKNHYYNGLGISST